MKPRQIMLLLAGLVIAVILAFFLRDITRQLVVTPIAYLWWAIKLAYAAIPQLFQWIFLLAFVSFIVISKLLNEFPRTKKYAEAPKPRGGTVQVLAEWLSNKGEGNYYKWLIASRLGKLASDMSIRLEGRHSKTDSSLPDIPDQLPPEDIRRYLKAGLDESFVDYPLPAIPYFRRRVTPFDLKVEDAVDFLESQMEKRSGHEHP
jgi:hypothetical protein